MTKLPASVSLYLRLKDQPVGHKFSRKMTTGERIILQQWVRTGHIESRPRAFEIVKKIEPIMHTQKIHNFIISRLAFTSSEITEAVGCSPQTVRKYLKCYASYYNLSKEMAEKEIIYRRKL